MSENDYYWYCANGLCGMRYDEKPQSCDICGGTEFEYGEEILKQEYKQRVRQDKKDWVDFVEQYSACMACCGIVVVLLIFAVYAFVILR